jgi:anaerobic magnesium-protoporphyrin IX monomethyl ester cyclase
MNVLMVNPPAPQGVEIVREGRCMQRKGAWTAVWPPISLASIAAALEQEGFHCQLVDCIIEGLGTEDLVSRAGNYTPHLAVINTATPSINADLKIASALKKAFPGITTLAIGIHVTALPDDCLEMEPDLDGIVRGEPELTVREAAERLRLNKSLAGVSGLSLREGDQIRHYPDREPADLDRLPFPAWHLVQRDLYRMPFLNRPFLLVGTNRGCPYVCEFCADATYYGRKLRLKSPERLVRELDWIKTKFGIRDFLFWAESFTLNPEWTKEVAKAIIRARLDIAWVCNSRPDHVDPELLEKIHAAGCWMIGYGLESGSDEILKAMNKKATVDQNRTAVLMAKRAGLDVTAHMVLGFPGETEETIRKTISFARSLPLDFAQFYCAVPFPGSRLYHNAKKHGWLNTTDWKWFEQNYSVLDLPTISAQEIMEWRRKAYYSFYLSPRRLLNISGRFMSRNGITQMRRMLKEFRGWV